MRELSVMQANLSLWQAETIREAPHMCIQPFMHMYACGVLLAKRTSLCCKVDRGLG